MNILHVIILKISQAVVAILILVGVAKAPVPSSPPSPPPTTVVDVNPDTGQATIRTGTSQDSLTLPTPDQLIQINPPAPAPVNTDQPPAVVNPPSLPSFIPIYIIQPPTPAPPAPDPAPQITPKPMTYSIEIISPIGGKGLGREYTASLEASDEANYIEIGAIIRDDNGNPVDNVPVSITATDRGQNKMLEATGNVTKIYVDGAKRTVPYYPFHYEFHDAGTHNITFSSGGVSQSVSMEVK